MTSQAVDNADAHQLINKVRTFIDTLNEEERHLFAALIGPGVEGLMSSTRDDEVIGFSQSTTWQADSLRGQLAAAIELGRWRIVERVS